MLSRVRTDHNFEMRRTHLCWNHDGCNAKFRLTKKLNVDVVILKSAVGFEHHHVLEQVPSRGLSKSRKWKTKYKMSPSSVRSEGGLLSQFSELSSRRSCEVQRIKFWLEFTDSHAKVHDIEMTLKQSPQRDVLCIACAWGTLHVYEAYSNEVFWRYWITIKGERSIACGQRVRTNWYIALVQGYIRMCVCMYERICVSKGVLTYVRLYIYVIRYRRSYIRTYDICTYICKYVCVRMHTIVCANMCTYMCTCVRDHTSVCYAIGVRTYVHIDYVRTCVRTCAYVCINEYALTCVSTCVRVHVIISACVRTYVYVPHNVHVCICNYIQLYYYIHSLIESDSMRSEDVV